MTNSERPNGSTFSRKPRERNVAVLEYHTRDLSAATFCSAAFGDFGSLFSETNVWMLAQREAPPNASHPGRNRPSLTVPAAMVAPNMRFMLAVKEAGLPGKAPALLRLYGRGVVKR